MKIILENAGKRYNREWIFRHVNFEFLPGNSYAITGPNGSGKSTLLQTLSGAISFNEGTTDWLINDVKLEHERINEYCCIAAPYLELIEEMTASEFLKFHQSFKSFIRGLNIESILEEVQLQTASHKQIRYFSSGMKQRLKLAQAIFSNVPMILLDEPCTNLDNEGIELYNFLIKKYCSDRTVIISSNDMQEYAFCKYVLNILNYKK